jgi:hypothetical protein
MVTAVRRDSNAPLQEFWRRQFLVTYQLQHLLVVIGN